MNKLLDKDLEYKIAGVLKEGGKASEVVEILRNLQDASGLKICTAVTKTDPAYKEVK